MRAGQDRASWWPRPATWSLLAALTLGAGCADDPPPERPPIQTPPCEADPCSDTCIDARGSSDGCECDPLCDPCSSSCTPCEGVCTAYNGRAIRGLECDAMFVEETEHGTARWSLEFDVDERWPSWLLSVLTEEEMDLVGVTLPLPNGDVLDLASYDNLNVHQQQVSPTVLTLLMPSSPRFRPNLQSGRHVLTVATELGEVPCFRLAGQEASLPPEPYLWVRVLGVGPRLGSVDDMRANEALMEALVIAQGYLQDAGIRLYVYEWAVLPDVERELLGVVDSLSSLRTLLQTLTRPAGDDARSALAVNIALIDRFLGEYLLNGVTGGLPGPIALHGSSAAGVVISTALLDRPFGIEQVGAVIAHELGHYLGLRHTSSFPLGGLDPLDDTPECPLLTFLSDPFECPDVDNMMFPAFSRHHDNQWSPAQRQVMRWHPSVTPRTD